MNGKLKNISNAVYRKYHRPRRSMVYWFVKPCCSETALRFEETSSPSSVSKSSHARNQHKLTLRPWSGRRYVPLKLLAFSELHGVTILATALRTSDPSQAYPTWTGRVVESWISTFQTFIIFSDWKGSVSMYVYWNWGEVIRTDLDRSVPI
jgi:hypothetical protein